ncbi:MAG: mechanosensitive ion channel family protein [Flavobacteriaceae bacterium]|nr:mechanosensitive ion channel family protein [Flavobacteriaceae bacterium]
MNINFSHILYDYLVEQGMAENLASYLNALGLLIAAIVLVYIIDFIVWKIFRLISVRLAGLTKTSFDDIIIKNRVPRYLAHIIPLAILMELLPAVFIDFQYAENIAVKIVYILGIILVLYIARSLLNSIRDYLKTLTQFRDKPIDSYIQVFMIFAWIAGLMTIFAILTDTTIWKFLTAMGAASAIILLVFKDSILGFVASIQVSINDMVRIGDWISFEKYGADGDVTEINLATVKVQNWDKTITTIPTYALISDSFKNWRGMSESGGRRIKRAIIIKQKGIKYLTEEDVERLKDVQLIKDYLISASEKIRSFNEQNEIDTSLAINGRHLTNIGVFRKYIQTYLEKHSALNKEMTLMTRQLDPTPQGIPIEIYAFSSDQRWQNYEYIIADIFDHVLAAVPYFDLEIFELPSSLQSQTLSS